MAFGDIGPEFNLEDLYNSGVLDDSGADSWLGVEDDFLIGIGFTPDQADQLVGGGNIADDIGLFTENSVVNPQLLLGDRGLNEGFVPGFTQQNIFRDTNPLAHPLANLGGDYYHSNVGYDGSNPLLDALGLTNTGNVFDQSLRFSGNEQNYFYDPFANRDNIGNVLDQSVRSVGNEQNYSYDPFANRNRNLVDNFDQSLRISGNQQNYAYDPFANRNLADSFDQSRRQVGNQQNYNYDPFANRNESNPLDQSLRPSGNQQNYTYDPFANDNIATNLFDQSGRQIGNEQNYSYDPFENRQGSNVFDQSLRSIGNQQNYDYDPFANRNDLGNVFDQSLRASGNEQNYSYDPFANRGMSLQPNPFDQSLRASGNEQNYSYDPFADRNSNIFDLDQSLRAAGNELNVNYDPFANRGGGIDVTGYTPSGGSVLDHPAWGSGVGGAVELPEPAGKFAFSPDFSPNFSPNFSPTFAPDFANMFAGFNPLEGLQLTPEGGAGGAGGIGYGGTGGSATVTNLFGDQGIFGGNPLLGQGAVEGGNVDFKQGAFDFGDMISSPLIDKGAFAGMIGPDAFDFSDFIGKDAFDFSNMISSPLISKGAFGDMGNASIGDITFDTAPLAEAIISDPRRELPTWLTDQDPSNLVKQINPWLRQSLGLNVGEDIEGAIARFLENETEPPEQITTAIEESTERMRQGLGLKPYDHLMTTPTSEWSRQSDPYSGYAGAMDQGPTFEGQEFEDYSEYMRLPLYDTLLGALDTANPFDTRRDAMLAGDEASIDYRFDEMKDEIDQRYANNLGSPAYRAELRDLQDRKARAKLGIEGDFAKEAARTDESMRRGRTDDLFRALGYEDQRVRDEMDYQMGLYQQAEDDYYNYLDAYTKQYYMPQQLADEGLRMMGMGIGSTLSPGNTIGSALSGMGDIGRYYERKHDDWTESSMDILNSPIFRKEGK